MTVGIQLRKRHLGGWHIHDAHTDLLIGWVVRFGDTGPWSAYVVSGWDHSGRRIGSFASRSEAVAEVEIHREVW